MPVVDRHGVRRAVRVLVLRDHHGDGELLEALGRERDADVAAGDVSAGRAAHDPGRVCVRGRGLGGRAAHLVCLIIQAIFSVETSLAAAMRSPSFSRPSSSITTRNSPRANAAMASSRGSKAKDVRAGASLTWTGRAGLAGSCGRGGASSTRSVEGTSTEGGLRVPKLGEASDEEAATGAIPEDCQVMDPLATTSC